MLTIIAGFTGPIVIVPFIILVVLFLSLVTWLAYSSVYKAKQKSMPGHLLFKLILVYLIVIGTVFIILEKTKY